jgi:SecD/SecF fusion protein
MVPNLARKIFGICLVSFMALWSMWSFNVHLGLDLSGGSRIVYGVDFEEAIELGTISADEDPQMLLQQTAQVFQRRLDGSGMADIPIYPQGDNQLVVELPNFSEEEVEVIKKTIVNQGSLQFRIILDSTDDLGYQTEVDKYQTWRLANPGDDVDITTFNRVPEAEGGPRPGVLWFPLEPTKMSEMASLQVAPDLFAVPVRNEGVIRGKSSDDVDSWDFTGAGLSRVFPSSDRAGFPAVGFEFERHLVRPFTEFTDEFKTRSMAIVLSNVVHSAPTINQVLPGGGIITGGMNGFSADEMLELITVLRTGSLRVQPRLESEAFVGASLGEDSVSTGKWSALVGLAVVFLFMLVYYWVNGMVACLALAFNGFILMGALYFTQATLTLPGLAGLVLTIGMAVDANILIFERVREERKRGREVPQAYKNGYENAFSTIVDANLTTLFTGLILFYVGTGPVAGFAATLSLGIICSMFSALVFSKVIMHILVFQRKVIKEVSMFRSLAGERHYGFTRLRKASAVFSGLVIVAGLSLFATEFSQMKGIDFAGGSSARIQLNEATDISTVRDRLSGDEIGVVMINPEDGSGVEKSKEFMLKKKLTPEQQQAFKDGDSSSSDLQETFHTLVTTKLVDLLNEQKPFLEISTISPRVSGDIQQKASLAMLLSLLVTIIYMNFRFKEYRYGIAAVIAVFHDVLVTLGVLAVASWTGLVQIEINLEIIAAFLTIIGYSLNDTIVVFDRVRENLPRRKESYAEIIDLSINQSLSRTILTSITTFVVVLILFIANRPMHNVLEGFSFAMLVGVVVGTYSSMFVASPALLYLDRWARKKKLPDGATPQA